jgi:hypothetical protein
MRIIGVKISIHITNFTLIVVRIIGVKISIHITNFTLIVVCPVS